MLDYPSFLLLMSFFLFFISGYMVSKSDLDGFSDTVPLLLNGVVIWSPFSMQIVHMGFISYYIHIYFKSVEDKHIVSPIILFGVYLLSRFVSKRFLSWRDNSP